MPVQFTTDDAPGYRRLTLWQDIVCDVYVQLDCKSDLGSAFRGKVTRAPLGRELCVKITQEYATLVTHGAFGRTTPASVKRPID